MNKCGCGTCQDITHLTTIIKKLPPEDGKFLEHIYEHLMATEMDLAHARAILDGTWPNSTHHLWYSLRRAIANEKKKDLDKTVDA